MALSQGKTRITTKEEAFAALQSGSFQVALDESSAELEFTEASVKKYPIYKPYWNQPNLDSPEIKDHAEKVVNLLQLSLSMISNRSFLDDGLTLMYTIGRNYILLKEGQSWRYLLQRIPDEDTQFTCEDTSVVKDMMEAPDLKEHIKSKYVGLSMSAAASFKILSPGASPILKLAYCGMFACLMLRSMVKDKVSLSYLYLQRDKVQNKLDQYYSSFYEVAAPFSVKVEDSSLNNANLGTPTNKEARSLMFHAFHLFDKKEINRVAIRVIGACCVQTLTNFGLPAISWTNKARRVAKLGNTNSFLGSILTKATEDSIANIMKYAANYVNQKGQYYYIARILNSDYFKSLGRDQNAELIIACFLIYYVNCNAEDKARLKRYKTPPDPARYGEALLFQYLKHIRTTSIEQSSFSKSLGIKSLMDGYASKNIDENALRAEATKIYNEAISGAIYQAEEEEEDEEEEEEEKTSKQEQVSAQPASNPESSSTADDYF